MSGVVRVVARWRARDGDADLVRQLTRQLAAASVREPGCLGFTVLEAAGRPGGFVLLEEYDGPAGRRAHVESDHFRELVLAQAAPRLEIREVDTYLVVYPESREDGA